MSEKPKIHICNGMACTTAGSQNIVYAWLLEYFTADEIAEHPCLGLCHDNYSVLIDGKPQSIFTKKTLKRILG